MVELPSAEHVAFAAVCVLAAIVVWDAYWLTKQRRDVPELGPLSWRWFCVVERGCARDDSTVGKPRFDGGHDGVPWALLEASNTPVLYAILWDVFLGLHLISLLVPKRYAITSTHLFADGQRYRWERLRMAKRQPKRRIMLLRNGWGPFGPLPLGGDPPRWPWQKNTSRPWNRPVPPRRRPPRKPKRQPLEPPINDLCHGVDAKRR